MASSANDAAIAAELARLDAEHASIQARLDHLEGLRNLNTLTRVATTDRFPVPYHAGDDHMPAASAITDLRNVSASATALSASAPALSASAPASAPAHTTKSAVRAANAELSSALLARRPFDPRDMWRAKMDSEDKMYGQMSLLGDERRRNASHAVAMKVMPGIVARSIAKAETGPPLFRITPSDREHVSNDQLQSICRLRSLPTDGNKAVLIQRIITQLGHEGVDLIKHAASVNKQKGGKSQKQKSRHRHRHRKTRRSS
jgi:hypothetical protein